MRRIVVVTGNLERRRMESDDFKSKIAELMAVNPSATHSFTSEASDTSPRFMNNFSPAPPMMSMAGLPPVGLGMVMGHGQGQEVLVKSSLNPHACDYQPKVTQ